MAFSERGELSIPIVQEEDGPEMSLEQAEDLAIECGAEEVIHNEDSDCFVVSCMCGSHQDRLIKTHSRDMKNVFEPYD